MEHHKFEISNAVHFQTNDKLCDPSRIACCNDVISKFPKHTTHMNIMKKTEKQKRYMEQLCKLMIFIHIIAEFEILSVPKI